MTHNIYVTPVGAVCSCGNTYPTTSSESAMTMAMHHWKNKAYNDEPVNLIDVRRKTEPMTNAEVAETLGISESLYRKETP